MDVRCVWEETIAWVCFMLVLSVMSREAAGDEQKPPWPHLQYLHFLKDFLLPVMFSCSSQCNILVLIKANKGKHSLMRGKRKMFWSPSEPDSSLFASSHNKSHGSFNGWMAVPCVNVSLSWLQRSSRWTALLLLAAMVPNSMLRRRTSIACVAIQYQFGSWKEFVIATWAHAILFLVFFSYDKWRLSAHNQKPQLVMQVGS